MICHRGPTDCSGNGLNRYCSGGGGGAGGSSGNGYLCSGNLFKAGGRYKSFLSDENRHEVLQQEFYSTSKEVMVNIRAGCESS